MEIIGYIHTDYKEKFGIPRQSGFVHENASYIEFEPKYRQKEAFRGLSEFSHIWVLWGFSKVMDSAWSATVKPPKLGGNKRMGVFATRSPFRPNHIGLSSVKLLNIEYTESNGPVLFVSGTDMLDGTPVYDIKPYLPYTDCHTDATGGWTNQLKDTPLYVKCPDELLSLLPEEKRQPMLDMLAADPRPGYQNDPLRRYGILYAGYDVRFQIDGDTLEVVEIIKL